VFVDIEIGEGTTLKSQGKGKTKPFKADDIEFWKVIGGTCVN
jgi:hypothetical protein